MKAAIPSAWSGWAPASPWSVASSSRASSNVDSAPAWSARFVRATAPGDSAARRAASVARLGGQELAAGTTRLTSPNRSASAADSGSGSSASSSGLRRADEPLEDPRRAAVRDQADLAEREHEPGGLGGDPEVAGERERGAGAGGDAVDRRDDRLGQAAHRPDQRVVALADLDVERGGVGLEPLAQVLAGAERPAGAGEDDGPDGRVRRERARTRRSAPPSAGRSAR